MPFRSSFSLHAILPKAESILVALTLFLAVDVLSGSEVFENKQQRTSENIRSQFESQGWPEQAEDVLVS